MKALLACLSLSLAMLAGCEGLNTFTDKDAKTKGGPQVVDKDIIAPSLPVKSTKAVTADQVNESNAREMLRALEEEMNRDQVPETISLEPIKLAPSKK